MLGSSTSSVFTLTHYEALKCFLHISPVSHNGQGSRRNKSRRVRIQSPWPVKRVWKQALPQESPTFRKREQPDPTEKGKGIQEQQQDISIGSKPYECSRPHTQSDSPDKADIF
ncbi:hypothetical protein FRX31_023117 [Thalictrum thalictroides]|uniref:Uncharacterized protein n=1 Tax=Thalictrum thalictroides TaxID=46969 RepID=A0A7J6VRU5_THATH|nr:hypothetical protein FRX31_023117 [Thalictrum thalictroides]